LGKTCVKNSESSLLAFKPNTTVDKVAAWNAKAPLYLRDGKVWGHKGFKRETAANRLA